MYFLTTLHPVVHVVGHPIDVVSVDVDVLLLVDDNYQSFFTVACCKLLHAPFLPCIHQHCN
jgi:hypothetical protein